MTIEKFKLYFYTIKHLKLSQIYWRLKYRISPTKPPTVTSASYQKWSTAWSAPTWQTSAWDGGYEFCFLAEKGVIEGQCSWSVENKSALWLYNLHYLDCLNAKHEYTLAQEKKLIDSWIHANKDLNSIGWSPYCLSLRIVNLVKWSSRNSQLSDKMCLTIANQTESLMTKVEYPIMGNHLFANGKALVFSGAFLEGNISAQYLNKGLEILDCEIKEQFLADGAHFELSPMYHQILMWDMCDLVMLAQISGVKKLEERLEGWKSIILKAENWRAAMLHPDDEIAFFNDSAMGIAPPTIVIDKFLVKLGLSSISRTGMSFHDLNHSGYFSVSQTAGHKLLITAAQIEPDYQPGHAHADSLSFELSLFGVRCFVNSGTSMYGVSDEREKQRSTAVHNTLTIANENSSQTWAGFRLAKRARIINRKSQMLGDSIVIEASHDGFVQIGKGGVHQRKWISKLDSLTIIDKIIGDNNNAVIRFFLHPNVNVGYLKNQSLILGLDNKTVSFSISAGKLRLVKSKWYPKFGISEDNNVIEVSNFDGLVSTQVRWDC